MRAICIVTAFAALLAGCGQRGPLYLPAKPAPISTAPTPQTTIPASPANAVPLSK